ncbi:hypothetical protein [Propionivibrio sp.]|uniref:hypothetical protein n=1 Tax=Propionivibrio sp. TaxID=2212460 RepID=UPI0026065BED|nr:hypothetical protein [Propionivibrio sp.]
MTSKLATLAAQIAELETDLELAQAAHRAASINLAGNAADGEALKHVRGTEIRIVDINGDLKLLRDARAFAEEQDQSAAAQLRKAGAVGKLRATEVLIAKRPVAAAKVDRALVVLKDAVQEWVDLNQEVKGAAISFYRDARPASLTTFDLYSQSGASSDLFRCALNAIASQVEEAMRPCEPRSVMAFNFVRYSPDSPELVVKDSKRIGERLIAHMNSVAAAEGMQL